MKVSVALCTYNGSIFLQDQLSSILNQNVQPDEIIICDDCSKDNTIDILNEFKRRSRVPVEIYQNEANLGLIRNFERAIKICSGDIIALADQDDVWKLNKIERIVEAFEENPKVDYVFSDAEIVDENLLPLHCNLLYKVGFSGAYSAKFKKRPFLCLLSRHFVTGATMAFRKSLRELFLPIPTKTVWIHDGWIALMASAAGAHGLPIQEPLIMYRQHSGQQMGAPESLKAGTLFERYQAARRDKQIDEKSFHDYIRSYDYLRERLFSMEEVKPSEINSSISLVDEIIEHTKSRQTIYGSNGFNKLKLTCKEVLTGRYALFSNSWKTVRKDLIV